MCILASILASIGGIFLKLVTSHSPLMHYKRLKFHCYLSLNKATVLGKEFAFLAVPQLPLERFTCKFSPWTLHACTTKGASFVVSGQYLKSNVPFLLYLGFYAKDFSETLHFELTAYVQHQFGLNWSQIKGTLLEEQCFFQLCTSSILNPNGVRFSGPVQTSLGAHPASYIMCNASLSPGQSNHGVVFTTHHI